MQREIASIMSSIKDTEARVLGGVQQSLLKYGRFQGSLDQMVVAFERIKQETRDQIALRAAYAPHPHMHLMLPLKHHCSQQSEELAKLRAQSQRLEARTQASARELHQVLLFKEQGQFYNAGRH